MCKLKGCEYFPFAYYPVDCKTVSSCLGSKCHLNCVNLLNSVDIHLTPIFGSNIFDFSGDRTVCNTSVNFIYKLTFS